MNLGRISYINVLPFFAKKHADFSESEHIPSKLNELVCSNALDASFISLLAYENIKNSYKILPNLCIASNDKVMSVKLFSKKKITDVKSIYMTNQSLSSVRAFVFLCKRIYGIDLMKYRVYDINNADAVFLIGNPALIFNNEAFEYEYDFGAMWKEHIGIEFIYSVVVMKNSLMEKEASKLGKSLNDSLIEFYKEPSKTIDIAQRNLYQQTNVNLSTSLLEEYYNSLIFSIEDESFYNFLNFVYENNYLK